MLRREAGTRGGGAGAGAGPGRGGPAGRVRTAHTAPPQITGVSILRAGETMEPALRAVCKDVRIGTILIQTNQLTGEPEVRGGRLRAQGREPEVPCVRASPDPVAAPSSTTCGCPRTLVTTT